LWQAEQEAEPANADFCIWPSISFLSDELHFANKKQPVRIKEITIKTPLFPLISIFNHLVYQEIINDPL